MAGSYLATGLIVNAAVSGETMGAWWEGLIACLVFFALGLCFWVGYTIATIQVEPYEANSPEPANSPDVSETRD